MNLFSNFYLIACYFYLNYKLVKVCSQCVFFIITSQMSVLRIYNTTGHCYIIYMHVSERMSYVYVCITIPEEIVNIYNLLLDH